MAKEYKRLDRIDKDNAAKGNPTSLADEYRSKKINEMAQEIILNNQRAASAQPRPGAGAGTATPAAPANDGGLPAAAQAQLRSGVNTTFSNGQVWTLDSSGNPKRVK